MLLLQADNLRVPGVAHGFFGRQGGVSDGIYASLNCGPGSGDERAKVIENRRRAMETFAPGTSLVTLYQIHSPDTVTVTDPWDIGAPPHADAMVTNRPHLALGILTADCAPVLLGDGEAGVIGAAHAGWKGALDGVIGATVAAMEKLGAARRRIVAAIGPCISQASYEVDSEFRGRFLAAESSHARFFVRKGREGHFHFDLEGFAAARLHDAGIANIEKLSACTYARSADFFSFRRATHCGEHDYGREISTIVLTSE